MNRPSLFVRATVARTAPPDRHRDKVPEMKAESTVLERPLWLAIAFMVLVRAVLLARYGVRFEISDTLWQLLDAEVLRAEPLRSLYFLHAQPPLFNALYAAALQLPAGIGPLFLQTIYLVSSIVMMVFSISSCGDSATASSRRQRAPRRSASSRRYCSTKTASNMPTLKRPWCCARCSSPRPISPGTGWTRSWDLPAAS
jgi:hypothetical protein